jgi:beta-galactosidase
VFSKKYKIKYLRNVVAAVAIVGLFSVGLPTAVVAKEQLIPQDWRFFKGDASGAEQSDFNDDNWLTVVIPHDWSIMDRAGTQSPFNPDAEAGQDSGYLSGGTGWYRRRLKLSEEDVSKVVKLKFEAVYMDADLWVNGQHILKHNYGYSSFTVDLSGKVKAGINTIAMKVRHDDPSSRWYSGSGIIRPVTLQILNCMHIDPNSVYVTTPVATEKQGVVTVSTSISNCDKSKHKVTKYQVQLKSRILDNTGTSVASATSENKRVGSESQ